MDYAWQVDLTFDSNLECGIDARCENYKCIIVKGCKSDGDCKFGEKCEKGICTVSERATSNEDLSCKSNQDCSFSEICSRKNKCIPRPPNYCTSKEGKIKFTF